MAKLSQLFPSKWLKAADLPEEGIIVTIRSMDTEKMPDGAEKLVLYFDEVEKGLVLNKTNANAIEKMYGDETDDWEDERISLFPTFVDFKGEQTEAIRVKPKKPKPKLATADAKPVKASGKQAPVSRAEDEDDEEEMPF
jgi:hypothetical protein